MKTSELILLLRNNGCHLVRHGSNHDVWYSPLTKTTFLVGRHLSKEIKTGTLNSILNKAGIDL